MDQLHWCLTGTKAGSGHKGAVAHSRIGQVSSCLLCSSAEFLANIWDATLSAACGACFRSGALCAQSGPMPHCLIDIAWLRMTTTLLAFFRSLLLFCVRVSEASCASDCCSVVICKRKQYSLAIRATGYGVRQQSGVVIAFQSDRVVLDANREEVEEIKGTNFSVSNFCNRCGPCGSVVRERANQARTVLRAFHTKTRRTPI